MFDKLEFVISQAEACRTFDRLVMEKLISALLAILKAPNLSTEVTEAACFAVWRHAVGDALSNQAIPLRLNGSVLVLAVADNIWKRQLEAMRGQLLFRLNQLLGQPLIKSLELIIDPTKMQKPATAQDNPINKSQRSIPIELLTSAAQIDDAGLRRAFLGAAVSCVNRVENP
jgi:hypothetical protein